MIKNYNYFSKNISLICSGLVSQHPPKIVAPEFLNFLDQVKSLETLEEIKFEKIAFPLLFLPFISRASEVIGMRLELKIDNRVFLLNYNHSIYSNSLNEGIVTVGNIVTIKLIENKDSFDENEWKELYKLSENTFVEESDSLKKDGAGAGLTDND